MASTVAAWPTVALDEVLRLDTAYVDVPESRQYPKLSVKLYGKGVVLDTPADGALLKMQRHQLAHAGQAILSEIWGKKGAIGIVPADGEGALCTSHFFLFDINHDRLDPRWLQAIFTANYLQEQLDEEARGTTGYAAVRPKHLLAATIPLPPLDEQRRIVARIEALAARIAEARGLRQAALAEAKSLPRVAVDQEMRQLSCVSRLVTVDSVARSVTDGDHQPPPKADWGVPFIFIRNITTARLDFSNCGWVPSDYFSHIASSRVPEIGDILYAAVGATFGTPCLVDTEQPFCFQRHIAIIKPERSQILPEYMWWALSSSSVYEQATAFVTGSAQPTVPLRGIRNLRFPLPTMNDQHHVVMRLQGIQAQSNAASNLQKEVTAKLDALLPSLLDRAFRGEL